MRHFKNLTTWRLRSYSTKNSNVAITVAKAGEIDDLIVEFNYINVGYGLAPIFRLA